MACWNGLVAIGLVGLPATGCGGEDVSLSGEAPRPGESPDAGAEESPVPSGDLAHAPPPVELDTGLAVPCDILAVDAAIIFDVEIQVASVSARMDFRTGGVAGFPLFDLRQTIDAAWLDEQPIAPEALAHRTLGAPEGSKMRVIEVELAPGSQHVLDLEYELRTPDVLDPLDSLAPQFEFDRVRFNFDLADYWAGHFVEQWLPANLIFDRHPLEVELRVAGTDVPHGVVTTGEAEALSDNHLRVAFPHTTSAHSPMLILLPEAELQRRVTRHQLVDGTSVEIRTAGLARLTLDLGLIEEHVLAAMNDFTDRIGPYQHGDTFTVFVGDRYAMEYDGGATLLPSQSELEPDQPSRAPIRHETFHSWFGRGTQPVSQEDGWLDEAWDEYFEPDDAPRLVAAIPPRAPGFQLVGDGPYDRDMQQEKGDPYADGPLVFGAIADLITLEELEALMAQFYADFLGERYSTMDLEQALYCATGEPGIRTIFQNYVWGSRKAADEADDELCADVMR